jgi:glycosyltransferase involved in cell wall biosynthesis
MTPQQKQAPRFSVIVPVYNRPQELDELLASLTRQHLKNFEVLVVEDGSTERSDAIVEKYSDQFPLHYFFKPNSGPGPSRNFGFQHARGEYFVVFDSDCIIPETYFEAVTEALQIHQWDAWGGPDKAHENFTLLQRAMGYTMSSVLTTGGIRGSKNHLGWFQPRSFNMGISRKVFEVTGGFRFDRYAEDIEFSIRMKREAFKVGLIPDAFVYHKRRTDFAQFYRQVYNFGKGRALVGKVYPEEVKVTHWFPTFFVAAVCSLPVLAFLSFPVFVAGATGIAAYLLAVFVHSWRVNRNPEVALLSVPSAVLQLWGYGTGFFRWTISNFKFKI